MPLIKNFKNFENKIEKEFLKNGFIIQKCENFEGLEILRKNIFEWLLHETLLNKSLDIKILFDKFHNYVSADQINNIRLNLYSFFNKQEWSRPTFFSLGKKTIETIVGNELVMQKQINLSIMMPKDTSSNISLHVDTHSGESPFQVVMWLPLTDVYGTKSMYIIPPEPNKVLNKNFKSWMEKGGVKKVLNEMKSDIIWPEIKYGEFIIFSPNLFHGSIVNDTTETRWSLNSRFKSLFTPYSSETKHLGTFYDPITTKPITELGIKYENPKNV